jgi:cytochrome c-type biogenesis protein CcmH
MSRKYLISTLILISIIVVSVSGTSYALTVKDISKDITMVGCEMLVSNCQTDAAQQMRDTIAKKLNQGLTKEEIIEEFIEKYGEQVYAAPTKKGFNLIAWIMPFLSLIVGGIIIYYFIRTRVISSNAKSEYLANKEEIDSESKEKLDEELKKYL